jgi:hypothetical protein
MQTMHMSWQLVQFKNGTTFGVRNMRTSIPTFFNAQLVEYSTIHGIYTNCVLDAETARNVIRALQSLTNKGVSYDTIGLE